MNSLHSADCSYEMGSARELDEMLLTILALAAT